MAETVLAASMVRGGAAPRYLYVDPAHTAVGEPVRVLGEGFVGESSEAPERGVPVFSCGPALHGFRLSIVDDYGMPVDRAGVLGEIVLGCSSSNAAST